MKDRVKQRAASKRHYEKNKAVMIARARACTDRKVIANRLYVLEYLLVHPCVDCGEDDPVVLDFDHRSGKKYAVSRAVTQGLALKTLIAEIEKCDVRCANCHRRKTYKERGLTFKDVR